MKDGNVYILRNQQQVEDLAARLREIRLTQPLAVEICTHKSKRSVAQNACLHGWCRHISQRWFESTGEQFSPKAWKEFFKRQHLGEETITICGRQMDVTRRSRDLTVPEMRDFLDWIDHFAGSELGITDLPRGPDYYEAMAA